ncbi:MAG: 50S ribosomal protein L24 [Parcubacteria group bacterium GW2011_GWE2_38_18]|nr:MAG: 50S ribosomal protein L24 [Parcubacteria group bacterium GW2011_GWE2_38_18]
MKIKKNDKVTLLAGKDKGKTGKVLQVFPERQRISVEGLNLLIKHLRPRKEGEKGQRIEFPAPLNISNAMLVCPKCGKSTRINYKTLEAGTGKKKGQKVRVCKKCKEVVD